MTESLVDHIARAIRERGPMPFAAFMQLALYHPHQGYYSSGARRTGWHGDFVTSPELDPSFGALWAEGFREIWEGAGRPEVFEVVEIGGGEGGFAAGVLGAATGGFNDALRYRLVERTPAARDRQAERLSAHPRVEWSASITEVPQVRSGCFFANEVLDNLPVHLAQMSGGELKEVCVGLRTDGGFERVLLAPSNPELGLFLERCGVELPEGHVYEVQLAAESLATRCAGLLGTGAVVFVDYGDDASELAQRPNGSLLCYSPSGADDEPLESAGSKDLTVHANWTAVSGALERVGLQVTAPLRQRRVLKQLGADALQDGLRSEFRRLSAAGEGAAAVRTLSRRQALGALTDEGGLGGLGVLVATKGMPVPAFAC